MRILHVLDHSIPLQSGYTFRTLSLLTEQRRLGWETHHLTTPRHTEPYLPEETVDGWVFHRTKPPGGTSLPVLRERAEMAATKARLNEIIPVLKSDFLHAIRRSSTRYRQSEPDGVMASRISPADIDLRRCT